MDPGTRAIKIKTIKRLVSEVPGERLQALEEYILGLLPERDDLYIRQVDREFEQMEALRPSSAQSPLQTQLADESDLF